MVGPVTDIPVKVEINEIAKSAVVLIPWHELGRVAVDDSRA